MKKLFLIYAALCLLASGCGEADGTLNTSLIDAKSASLLIDSDIILWFQADGTTKAATCPGAVARTPAADETNVTITSTPYASTTGTALPVRVNSATIYYTPVDPATMPAIAPVSQILGQVVPAGGSMTLPIRVATQEQKDAFFSALACNGSIYNYYVTIVFSVTEIGGKSSTISTALQLRFADYADK